jgi:hypothetical protein
VSNAGLKQRIERALLRFEQKEINARQLAEEIKVNSSALEGMPYHLVDQLSSIMHEVKRAADFDEEGFDYDLSEALRKLNAWLDAIPVNV